MLAYVFWHWPREAVAPAAYEAAQRAFHSALAADPPAGFRRSWSLAIERAPWAPGASPVYEDWYLVNDSAGLDPLNAAAVSAARRGPHDAAAALALGGTAGLYRLRAGAPLDVVAAAAWFARPAGMSYEALLEALEPVTGTGTAALWCRQMTLGPAPEFCLQSRAPVALPEAWGPSRLAGRVVWPEPR